MRGDAIFMEDPELAVKIWLYYNRALLRLASEVPDRCVVVNVETIGRAPAAWIAAVSECSGVQLDAPQDAIYEPDLLHRALARDRAGVIFRHFPEAVELYAALERRAFRPAGTDLIPWDRGATPEEERRLAVRDWQRLCAHRRIATR
jgi:hypothetical protein